MKKLLVATMLVASLSTPVAIAQESEPVAAPGQSATTDEEWKGSFAGVKNTWTTILAIAAGAGILAILGKVIYDVVKPHLPQQPM